MPRIKRKSWTVMVYMAGDNNLDPEGVVDLKEMKRVGSTDKVNIVAQFDRAKGHVARRYYFRKGGLVTADAVANIGRVDTGDPQRLTDFIDWVIDNYPAARYLLVLWNHGQGWDDTDIYAGERHRALRRLATGRIQHAVFDTPVRQVLSAAPIKQSARAILLDDNAKDFLDNLEMKKVLRDAASRIGRKIDVFGMDACLMSMIEVGYQVRGAAQITVGSEETEPGEGWPYDRILKGLTKDPAMSASALSRLIVDEYLKSYGASAGVTYSACDLAKAPQLAKSIRAFARILTKSLNDSAPLRQIQIVRNQVQTYEVTDNIDLIDFCSLLASASKDNRVKAACRAVIAAANVYVVRQGFKGKGMSHSNGVAIYFPLQAISPLYAGLDFSKATRWDRFLAAYLAAIHKR
jgi:hypothetical protein